MADSRTINSIDQTTLDQGYITADCTLSINSQSYTQSFVSSHTDPTSILADLTSQAEVFKNKVEITNTSPTTTIDSLVGDTISI